eukprot:m51a1_g8456 hypothetical protein (608) ;mRNA; f:415194-418178
MAEPSPALVSVEYLETVLPKQPGNDFPPVLSLSFRDIAYDDEARLMCITATREWRESRSLRAADVIAAGVGASLYQQATFEKIAECALCRATLEITPLEEVFRTSAEPRGVERYQFVVRLACNHADLYSVLLVADVGGTMLVSRPIALSSRPRRSRRGKNELPAPYSVAVTSAPAAALTCGGRSSQAQSFLDYVRSSASAAPALETLLYGGKPRVPTTSSSPLLRQHLTVEVHVSLSMMPREDTLRHLEYFRTNSAPGKIRAHYRILPSQVVVVVVAYRSAEAAAKASAVRDKYLADRSISIQLLSITNTLIMPPQTLAELEPDVVCVVSPDDTSSADVLSRFAGKPVVLGSPLAKSVVRKPAVIGLVLTAVARAKASEICNDTDGAVVVHDAEGTTPLDASAGLRAEVLAACPGIPVAFVLAHAARSTGGDDGSVADFCGSGGFTSWAKDDGSAERLGEAFEALVDDVVAARRRRGDPYMRVRVTDPLLVGKDGMAPHTRYTVTSITWSMDRKRRMKKFVVHKRYNDFVALRASLEAKCAAGALSALPALPEKLNMTSLISLMGRFDPAFVEQRRQGLQEWLCAVARRAACGQEPVLHMFLTQDDK